MPVPIGKGHILEQLEKGVADRGKADTVKWDIREYGTVDSTNLEAGRLLGAGAAAGLVVWAHHQTAGRGRLGRSWKDIPGKSLMVSLAFEGGEGFWAAVSVALAARAAIRRGGGEGPLFKWPNDLVYGWRKVGGILSESCRIDRSDYIVVGFGLNVSYRPGELDIPSKLPATSLLIEEGRNWEIKALLLDMLDELGERLGRGEPDLLEEYHRNLAFVGEKVRVKAPFSVVGGSSASGDRLEGILEGVDGEGHLLLRRGEETIRLASGDLVEC
jgi:BirA family biotin operon repressor/biotin-[acetyl-CoA-carboxylase] ligase